MIDSPLAHLMNIAFCLQETFFLIGAVLVVCALRHRNGFFLTFAAMNAIGNILVGTVHGGPVADVDDTAWVHGAGAVLAIAGGNMAILTGSGIIRNAGAAPWFRTASLGLAALGPLSFLMLVIDTQTASMSILPDGVWERCSVCTILVWQMFTVAYLLRSSGMTQGGAVSSTSGLHPGPA